jgi:Rrf2 family nitric oxide-sensitive transcriptional repressor
MISATAEYALRAAVFLASKPESAHTVTEVAAATKVPTGYLAKILQGLAKAGLATSQRGVRGGFQLARPASEISVLEVLAAANSPVQRIERCPLGLEGHTSLCPVHKLVDESIAKVEAAFGNASLESLLGTGEAIQPLCDG